MKFTSFKDYLNEMNAGETYKYLARSGIDSVGISNPSTRQKINAQLAKTTEHTFLTPYIGLGAIARVLAYASIILPQYVIFNNDAGEVVFDVNQFGAVAGVNLDGTKVVPEFEEKFFVYYTYEMNEEGTYDVFGALVNDVELADLMAAEDEVDDTEEDIVDPITEAKKALEMTPIKHTDGKTIGHVWHHDGEWHSEHKTGMSWATDNEKDAVSIVKDHHKTYLTRNTKK